MSAAALGWPDALPRLLDEAIDAARHEAVGETADEVTDRRAEADGGRLFRTSRSAALDELEEFPAGECALLDELGITRAYVPAELGGVPGGLPELLAALRTVARRDLTVAVAHGKTFLGAVCTWVAGDREQRQALAREVLRGAVVAWGLTEPGLGSDLLAGRFSAVPASDAHLASDDGSAPDYGSAPDAHSASENGPASDGRSAPGNGSVPGGGSAPGGGWRLDGVKWPVNNATRGRFVCVLARTSPEGGERGFSLFLVDKADLPENAWRNLPKEPTHGIRGADISGIGFEGAVVPADTLIGKVGDGLETVLRALQLTRTVCVSLSLGAGEHALRLARDFAASRDMYGTTLIELPLARRVLGRAAASLALADAASLIAARSAHCLTGEMSVVSALVKAGVPDIVQQAIDDLAEILGVRGFLTRQHADGMFQKLERDHRIVSIFDGTTAVNRASLAAQFALLRRRWLGGGHDEAGLAAVEDLTRTPPLDFTALRLLSRTGCTVVQALPAAVRRLAPLAAAGAVPPRAHHLTAELAAETASVVEAMAALPPGGRDTPPQAFAVARRYELCFAGASAAHLILAAPGEPDRNAMLTAALERALELLRPGHQAPNDAYEPLLTSKEPVR
ncbi:acyl-CoA dehydrogenase family protein [Sphaerimonospora sp. CA-214678]|uniref:acyl-CoA dehydrogenase family protein n=1 Tax=Sphaerimonospora sp. CA-214678 TaxID=3240029 RepID=UPI003D8D1E5E